MKKVKTLQCLALAGVVMFSSCHSHAIASVCKGLKERIVSHRVVHRASHDEKTKKLATRSVRSHALVARNVVVKPSSLSSTGYDVAQTGHVTVEQLERHFARYGGALRGKGEFFLQMEKKYNVSALFMAGIATQESSAGKSARARRVKDSFGMTGRRGKRWATHEENIEDAFKMMSGNLYVKSGRRTPSRIGSRYCTTGGWASKVTRHMKNIVSNS